MRQRALGHPASTLSPGHSSPSPSVELFTSVKPNHPHGSLPSPCWLHASDFSWNKLLTFLGLANLSQASPPSGSLPGIWRRTLRDASSELPSVLQLWALIQLSYLNYLFLNIISFKLKYSWFIILYSFQVYRIEIRYFYRLLLLLLSRFSSVPLCATPQMEAHQVPLSLGFSRQEHWSRLPLPSPFTD